jgi:hypothetical protein
VGELVAELESELVRVGKHRPTASRSTD